MTIYVIDDHPMMREAVCLMIKKLRPTVKVVEMERLGLLPDAITENGFPTFISLDLKLPDTQGVSGIRQVKLIYPDVPLAVVSATPAEDMEGHCIDAGADIYIEKTDNSLVMGEKIRALLSAQDAFLEPLAPGKKVTPRQLTLLKLLHKGMSNKEIADELEINEETVKVHLWRLFKKIEVKNRTAAVVYAGQYGLLPA